MNKLDKFFQSTLGLVTLLVGLAVLGYIGILSIGLDI